MTNINKIDNCHCKVVDFPFSDHDSLVFNLVLSFMPFDSEPTNYLKTVLPKSCFANIFDSLLSTDSIFFQVHVSLLKHHFCSHVFLKNYLQ